VTDIVKDTSTFPLSIWASAGSDTSLTTNACESFLSQFNSNYSHYYKNQVLKIFQTNTYSICLEHQTPTKNFKKKENKTISITKYQIKT